MKRNIFAACQIALALTAICVTGAFAGGANTIVQANRAFTPGEITIAPGSTLDFANNDEFIHQIYVDSAGFNYDFEEQQPGQTLHIKFPASGTFPVRCHIHPKMLLVVHVK